MNGLVFEEVLSFLRLGNFAVDMEHVIVALLELEHVLAAVVMKGITANVRYIFIFVPLRNVIVALYPRQWKGHNSFVLTFLLIYLHSHLSYPSRHPGRCNKHHCDNNYSSSNQWSALPVGDGYCCSQVQVR